MKVLQCQISPKHTLVAIKVYGIIQSRAKRFRKYQTNRQIPYQSSKVNKLTVRCSTSVRGIVFRRKETNGANIFSVGYVCLLLQSVTTHFVFTKTYNSNFQRIEKSTFDRKSRREIRNLVFSFLKSPEANARKRVAGELMFVTVLPL